MKNLIRVFKANLLLLLCVLPTLLILAIDMCLVELGVPLNWYMYILNAGAMCISMCLIVAVGDTYNKLMPKFGPKRHTIMCLLVLIMVGNVDATPSSEVSINPDKVEVFDTVWDILNVLYDGGKIAYGYATANPIMVANGFTDLAIDATCMVIPGVPAGSSKLAAWSVKQGAKQGAKSIAKRKSFKFLEHALARHGAHSTASGTGKFFVSGTTELAELFVKAKKRIASGHANIQFSGPTGAFHYLVDMGESVGKYSNGINKAGVHRMRETNIVSIVINVGTQSAGSFAPVKPNQIAKEVRGFVNVLNWK